MTFSLRQQGANNYSLNFFFVRRGCSLFSVIFKDGQLEAIVKFIITHGLLKRTDVKTGGAWHDCRSLTTAMGYSFFCLDKFSFDIIFLRARLFIFIEMIKFFKR